MDAISVLLVGDADRDEFREAREFLAAQTHLTFATGVAEGLADLADAEISPDVVVVAATYPGESPAGDIERLRRAAPLARLISLVGSWCEGETRSGQPWTGMPRIYAHQFVPRFAAELARLALGQLPTWSLPVTATEDERLLAADDGVGHSQQRSLTPSRPRGTIAIVAHDAQTAESLADACRSRGYTAVRVPHGKDKGRRTKDENTTTRSEDFIAMVWDARCGDQRDEVRLRDVVRQLPGVPMIALLDFPRVDERTRALEAGAAAVVSKPFLLDDLFWQIQRLAGIASP